MSLPIRNVRFQLSQGSLFWREVGRGLPLVFLHGAWQDGEQWMPLLQGFGDRHHCLAPDLLGFGESSRLPATASINLQVEVLEEWLDSLRCESVVLIAEGLGAWIAATYALRFPERVQGLVLIAPEGVRGNPRRWSLERSLVGRFPWRAWFLQAIAPLARPLGWRWVAHQLAWRHQLRRSPTACHLLFRRRSRLIQAEYLDEQIGWLKMPLLLLQGEQASPTTVAMTRAYSAAPLANMRIIPSSDPEEMATAEAIAPEIRSWLSQLEL